MVYTISLSPKTEKLLQQRAEAVGKPAGDYVVELVEDAVTKPALNDILAPIHEEFRTSGISDQNLDGLLQNTLNASRDDRPHGKGV